MRDKQSTQENFDNLSNKFCDRLIEARKKADIDRELLAKKLGLADSSQIYRYESGKAKPSIDSLARLAEILDIDLHWLITGRYSARIIGLLEQLRPAVLIHLGQLEQQLKQKQSEQFKASLAAAYGDEDEQGKLIEIDKEIKAVESKIKEVFAAIDIANSPKKRKIGKPKKI